MHKALKTVASLLALPFAIVLGTFVALVLAVMLLAHLPRSLWMSHRWRSHLRREGRYKNPNIRPDRIVNGTLIVDSPTVGWSFTRCWWTPDDIPAISPEPIPTQEERERHTRSRPERLEFAFDRWVASKYLSDNGGSAVLLSCRRGDVTARRIAERHNVPIVNSWSGPIAFFPIENRNAEPTADG